MNEGVEELQKLNKRYYNETGKSLTIKTEPLLIDFEYLSPNEVSDTVNIIYSRMEDRSKSLSLSQCAIYQVP